MTTPVLNSKIREVKSKIPDASSCMTTAVLFTKIIEVDKKMPYHDKYITTPQFNKLTAERFRETLKQTGLVSKNDFNNKLINFS